MNNTIFIIGAGGFGREVFGIIEAIRRRGATWHVAGFVDDSPSEDTHALVQRLGSKIIGPLFSLRSMTGISAVVAIGSPATRRAIADGLEDLALHWPTLVHPDATIGEDVTLGSGTIIAAGARLSTNILCGRHVQIDQNATIGHDTTVRDFARINPQGCLSGSVTIGGGTVIGASACILPGIEVGRSSIVGAGAVVTRPVPDGAIVKGVPAV